MVELRHPVVELVVSGNHVVVARCVHDVDERLALRQRAHDVALNGVAGIHERDVPAAENAFTIGNVACQRRISQRRRSRFIGFANGAVDVVGVQDDDGAARLRIVGERTTRQPEHSAAKSEGGCAGKELATGNLVAHKDAPICKRSWAERRKQPVAHGRDMEPDPAKRDMLREMDWNPSSSEIPAFHGIDSIFAA